MSRILIVDDEKSIRITLSEMLKNEGYETDSASDAEIALKVLDYQKYDMIITDIIMPRMSGIDFVAKVREKQHEIQIVIMTGEPTVETAVKAVKLGANDYLTKPLGKEDLLSVVQRLEQARLVEQARNALAQEYTLAQDGDSSSNQALQSTIQGITSLLFSLVETRDPYTASHQRRVGNLSAAIAAKMGLPTAEVQLLRIIGYIHDIGKIMLPLELLTKPGALSSLEMQMIRNHSLAGYEMLTKVELPEIIKRVIYEHHERCNGTGYPRGLHDEEISPESKIVIVADVVEAIMSHRPYRPALGLDTALHEIRSNAGTLFDPQVVNACVELFQSDGYEIDDNEYL